MRKRAPYRENPGFARKRRSGSPASASTLHRWRRIRTRPIFIPGQKTAEPKLNTVHKDDTEIYTEQNVQAESTKRVAAQNNAAAPARIRATDGLDGLASTVSVLVLTFFAVLTFILKDYSLTVFSVALIAGLIGFLKFNAYPAKVFMGDTGSLAIGGAITTIAIISGNPLIIVLVGGIYVIEALSVIIQVTSFKLTGKRVFKMAPIHHHFEQCGWNEVKIVTVFSIITVLLCIIGFFAI